MKQLNLFKTMLLMLCLLLSGTSPAWGEEVTRTETFTKDNPNGWESWWSVDGVTGYAKVKNGEFAETTDITNFIPNGKVLSSPLEVNLSCGTFGTWKGNKEVTVTVSLLDSSDNALSSGSFTKSGLGSSENTYIGDDYPISVPLPTNPENIAKIKVMFALQDGSDVLRFKYLKLHYFYEGDEPQDDNYGLIKFGKNDVSISGPNIVGTDNLNNSWSITTMGTDSFTPTDDFSQVGSGSKPATSITFSTILPKKVTITSMSAKFGGFSSTAGNVTLKVGENTIGSGVLTATSDVIVNSTSSAEGKTLTVTVDNIAKGVKCYYISYTFEDDGENPVDPFIPDFINTSNLNLETGDVPYDIRTWLNIPDDYDTETYAITSTINGQTQKEGEYSCVYPYLSFQKEGTYSLHVIAPAIPGKYAETSGDIVVNVSKTLTTMDDIFAKANQVKGVATDVKVNLGNWVVSAVKSTNAFVTDGTKGFIIYSQNESHGFEVGDILSGVVNAKIQLYRGSAEFTNFTAASDGLTITKGGSVPVNEIADITTLTGVNTGSIVSLSKLTCKSSETDTNGFKSYIFSDGENEITLYGIFQELPDLTIGNKYNFKGMYLQFYETREVGPLSNDDIEEVVTVKYKVTISEMTNGSVTTEKENYEEGETVSLSVTPELNYSCSSLTVVGASGTVPVEDYKFTMPAEDVVVSAIFAENPKVNVTWNDRGTEIVCENVYVGSVLQFPSDPSVEDWKFMGWTANSSVASSGEGIVFLTSGDVVPEGGATYYAVFAELDKESAAGSYTLDYNVETALAKSTAWGSYGTPYTYTASDGGVWVIKAVKNKGMQLNTGKDASIKVPDCPGKINSVEITGAPQAHFYFSKTDYTGSKIDYIAHAEGTQVTLDLAAQNVTTGYIWASNTTSVTKVVVNYDAGESYTNYTLLPTTYYKIIVDDVEHGSISSNVSRAGEGTEISLYYEEDDHYHFVEWIVLDSEWNEIEVNDSKFVMPASDVFVSAEFTEDTKYAITWSIDGVTETEYYYHGEEVSHTNPVVPEKFNSDWTFRGWVLDGTVVTESTDPEYVTPTTATKNVTYVAVFAIEHISTSTEKELKKLDGSTTFADGDEIVVFAKSGDNWYGMYQETVSTSYVNYFKVDHTPVIADVNDDAKKIWLVSAEENNKWKLGDEAHGYLLSTPSSNNLVVSKDSHSTLTIVWSQSNNGYTIKNGDRWIACRADLTGDNQYKYRGAGNQNTPQAQSIAYFDLYRIESVNTITYSDFTTSLYLLLDEETNIPVSERHSGTYTKVKVKRTIKAGNWSTLCLPFDMDDEQVAANFGDDVEVKELTGLTVNGNAFTMHFSDSEFKFIYSGTPCMVRVSKDISEILVNDIVVNTVDDPDVVDVWTDDNSNCVAYYGNYEKYLVPQSPNNYIISKNKFYFVNSTVTNKGFRGWFEIMTDGVSAPSLSASFDDETSGIKSVNVNENEYENIYNIAGQRVSKVHKGVYIHNGKKYIAK